MIQSYAPPALEEIEAARERIAGTVIRTPLVRFDDDLYLKLENLQPIGSFKLRGAGNALALAGSVESLWTASAGNMAQAVAWHARERGVPCSVVVPETAPHTKLDAVARLGAEVEHGRSFVDGMGGPRVFPEMFELVQQLVEGSIVLSVEQIANAVRLLAERSRVVAEGAGAAPLAAALTGRAGTGKIVCVVSGGNIDSEVLRTILAGEPP